MAQAGWYPDPGGEPGRLRYFDGQSWSSSTKSAHEIGSAGSASGPGASGSSQPRRSGAGLWILLGIVALVVVIVIGATQMGNRPREITNDPPRTDPSISSWDDGSPAPTPTPSVQSPPSSPPPTPTEPPPMERCPTTDNRNVARDPDGRFYGGGLSFPGQPPPWRASSMVQSTMYFATDVSGQIMFVTSTWFVQLAVGELRREDGFTDPKSAAARALSCITTSSPMGAVSGRTDLFSKEYSLAGHPGWTMQIEVRVSDRSDVAGSVFQVIVLDLGQPDSLSFFISESTIDHADEAAARDAAIAGLRVE